MSDSWPIARLGDLVNFISGSGFPEHLQGQDSGEIPFYKVSDMSTPGNEVYLKKANNYVSNELARKRGWKIAPAEAVTFAKVGAALLLNRRRKLSTNSLIDNNMVAVEPKNEVASNWIYWQLFRVDFADFVQDGALPSINQKQLAEISIPTPGYKEEEEVSKILDTLDTVIRETEAIIAKLKAVKQGLLHDLLTRGIDANGELRPPQSEAPHLYKDSPLGWIPDEWEKVTLGEIADRSGGFMQTGPFGSQLHAHEYVSDGVPVIMPQDIIGGELSTTYIARINQRKAVVLSRHRVQLNDLVFSRRGDLSRCVAIEEEHTGWLCGTGCLLARMPAKEINAYWLALAYSQQDVQSQVMGRAVGSTMANLNASILGAITIARPEIQEQNEISLRLKSMAQRIKNEERKLARMQFEKAGLMDDLLTGRVRVTQLLAPDKALI